jgi:hypothetical protein
MRRSLYKQGLGSDENSLEQSFTNSQRSASGARRRVMERKGPVVGRLDVVDSSIGRDPGVGFPSRGSCVRSVGIRELDSLAVCEGFDR